MRRAARVDANQAAIVAALRKMGASVQPLHTIGKGCPDLLIGWRGKNLLAELKFDSSFTMDQLKWKTEWRGNCTTLHSVDEAIAFLKGIRIR